MKQLVARLLISGVAVAVVLVRTFRPDVKLDPTTLTLVAVAVSPWLSGVIKGVEVPGGLKLEYRDQESRPSKSASPDPHPAGTAPTTNFRTGVLSFVRRTLKPVSDSYIDRLAKLTPVEPIALFVVISSLLQSTPTRAGVALEWCLFGLLLLFTPLLLRRLGVSTSQAIVSTLLFCVWIFAIGGPFTALYWYRPWYGGLVLALFMPVLPLFDFYPRPRFRLSDASQPPKR